MLRFALDNIARNGNNFRFGGTEMKKPSNAPHPVLSLVRRAQADDREAMDALLLRYDPLIRSMSARFTAEDATAQDREDLVQEATILFCEAVMSFDVRQEDVELGLYARICIKNGLVSLLRKQSRRFPTVSLEEGGMDEVHDEAQDPARQLIDRESSEALCRVIEETLSPYENRIWWLYLSGCTAAEIAGIVGKDDRSVQNAVYRIRKKLRAVIAHP